MRLGSAVAGKGRRVRLHAKTRGTLTDDSALRVAERFQIHPSVLPSESARAITTAQTTRRHAACFDFGNFFDDAPPLDEYLGDEIVECMRACSRTARR